MKTESIASENLNAALNKYADEAHATARAKGFWGEKSHRHQKQALMLVISELCEALEEHRKIVRNVARVKLFSDIIEIEYDEELLSREFKENFELCIKDTLEDELADVMIRLLDFARGYGIAIDIERFQVSPSVRLEENFAAQLWNISGVLHQFPQGMVTSDTKFLQEQSINTAMLDVMYIASKMNIELQMHIELKMQYNAYRDQLNGKKY